MAKKPYIRLAGLATKTKAKKLEQAQKPSRNQGEEKQAKQGTTQETTKEGNLQHKKPQKTS